jgi:hypothetical protein
MISKRSKFKTEAKFKKKQNSGLSCSIYIVARYHRLCIYKAKRGI